jgi:crossover junction endodeoxyribonuclease RuvC
MKCYLGIDPGATGALALFSQDGCDVRDFGPEAILSVRDWAAEHTIVLAALEKVNAMPGQGVTSMFNFGANVGWWRGALDALRIPYVEVRPQKWMPFCNVPPKADKADKPGIIVARKMFPSMADHLAACLVPKKDLKMAFWLDCDSVVLSVAVTVDG